MGGWDCIRCGRLLPPCGDRLSWLFEPLSRNDILESMNGRLGLCQVGAKREQSFVPHPPAPLSRWERGELWKKEVAVRKAHGYFLFPDGRRTS